MIEEFLFEALKEDWGRGDLFALVGVDQEVQAFIIAKDHGIFSGEKYLQTLCAMRNLNLDLCVHDTQEFPVGSTLASLSGSYLELLKIERVALNLLQHSSGIATHTRTFVQKIAPFPIKLLDTRKTRPLLRSFEKYSVRNGGASNHRYGLDDGLMLKDTHLARIKNLRSFVAEARKKLPFLSKIEVECENIKQCIEAFEANVDVVMCDNMTPGEIRKIVQIRDASYRHIILEASGNLDLDNLVLYAESGVDAISCGSLIHQATWLDLSMEITPD